MGKLPDPAAAVPLSDYRSEQLHAEELAHSKTPTHTHTYKCRDTSTHTQEHKHTGMQHNTGLEDHRPHPSTDTLLSKMKEPNENCVKKFLEMGIEPMKDERSIGDG